jgi:uncharacterized protein (DUF1684 family)
VNRFPNASRTLAAALFLTLMSASTPGCGDAAKPGAPAVAVGAYDVRPLLAERAEKDAALRGNDSPIPQAVRSSSFTGLSYYPPNPSLAFRAPLQRFAEQEIVQIAATGGDVRMMTRVGRFTFEIDGKRCSLTVFSSADDPSHLFLPFRDATNGNETYEVGRYIDLEAHDGDEPYLVDFNRCYNPYCAYNDTYTCPIVPAENSLPVAIRAGEKLPSWGIHH